MRRLIAHWSRVLHTYLSMVSFSILLFFALTGITLNHQSAMTGESKVSRFSGRLDLAIVGPSAGTPDQADIVQRLSRAHRLKGHLSEFRADDDQLTISFKGPGYAADAFVDRKTGTYELTESRMGAIAIINDLHKGRDTGTAWAQIIDVSAVLMTLVSVTGLTLIFFLHKRLALGLWMLAIGTAICVVVYYWFVA